MPSSRAYGATEHILCSTEYEVLCMHNAVLVLGARTGVTGSLGCWATKSKQARTNLGEADGLANFTPHTSHVTNSHIRSLRLDVMNFCNTTHLAHIVPYS
jgi:hypothetical protein